MVKETWVETREGCDLRDLEWWSERETSRENRKEEKNKKGSRENESRRRERRRKERSAIFGAAREGRRARRVVRACG